jgi:hypothetical protein
MSRIFAQPQAAGKTGLVIRIVIAKSFARVVMAALLADTGGRIKRIMISSELEIEAVGR